MTNLVCTLPVITSKLTFLDAKVVFNVRTSSYLSRMVGMPAAKEQGPGMDEDKRSYISTAMEQE